MIKQLFMSICFICPLYAMENNFTHQITLVAIPSATFALTGLENRPNTYGNISASLYGFSWEHNKIELLSNHSTWNFGPIFTDEGQYTPETIKCALQNKTIPGYPLMWHKKIELTGNEELTCMIRNEVDGREELNPVPLSDTIKKRLLRYLTYDTTDEHRNSFDFCYEVTLEHAQPDEKINEFAPLITYIDFVTQQEVLPGDTIGLFKYQRSDEYGYSSLLQLKHCAIALGNNVFLSKLGSGGILHVSTLQSLKNFWKCSGCAKIDPAIGKQKYFVKNPFCSIPYRIIKLEIYPHETIPVHGISSEKSLFVVTYLSGLRCTNNQMLLRSEHLLTPTITQKLESLLLTGATTSYPLHLHKKICYLAGDEIIGLCIANQDNIATAMRFPKKKQRKLLTYLMVDTESKTHCCFDFCKALCLKKFNENKVIIDGSYESQWSSVNETELKLGDAIALGTSRDIKHWAMALGNNMYLSKFSSGGALAVTSMLFMMKLYNCTGFVAVKPTITRYPSFWGDFIKNFAPSSIQFNKIE